MKILEELANYFATDKRKVDHNYTQFYEKYFEPLRFNNLNVCEIGILNHSDKKSRPYEGASLLMWKEYFINSNIHGIDINNHMHLSTDRLKIYIADQGNRNELKTIVENVPMDIIIEDGSHLMHHQQISLGFMFKYLKSGGYYVIEDLHTSHPQPPFKPKSFQLSDNDTLTEDMLYDYNHTQKINSIFMTDDEIDYLNENIKSCIIERGNISNISFIQKK